jgi:hypothetical protein
MEICVCVSCGKTASEVGYIDGYGWCQECRDMWGAIADEAHRQWLSEQPKGVIAVVRAESTREENGEPRRWAREGSAPRTARTTSRRSTVPIRVSMEVAGADGPSLAPEYDWAREEQAFDPEHRVVAGRDPRVDDDYLAWIDEQLRESRSVE